MTASISFSSYLDNFNSELWGHHFKVPKEIAETFIVDNNRRIIAEINGMVRFNCALMPYGEVFYILVNKDTRKKLSLVEGDMAEISITKDTSEYGMDMPDEFLVVMQADELAWQYFEALTMGKKRSLLYLVGKVKNIDSRINKSLAIALHLKENGGLLDFKMLGEVMKRFNGRINKF
jgi:hypothetical protein